MCETCFDCISPYGPPLLLNTGFLFNLYFSCWFFNTFPCELTLILTMYLSTLGCIFTRPCFLIRSIKTPHLTLSYGMQYLKQRKEVSLASIGRKWC